MNRITSKILSVHNVSSQLTLHTLSRCSLMQSRDYARGTYFNEYFQNPIFRKEDQSQLLDSGELKKILGLPIKPPGIDETSSVYHDPLVNKVINHIMRMGKKEVARTQVEKAFENIKRIQIERYHLATKPEAKANIELDPKTILHKAIENARPLLMLSPIKRGGITYQVPGPITEKRSLFLAIKWLLEASNEKERNIKFPQKFAWELLDAANNTGSVIKRKQDLHKQCEANRAYAHYRWQ